MYKNILFDLDGTLTDPGIGITDSVAYALSKFGISVQDRTELYKFIGPPLVDSFRDFYNFSLEDSNLAVKYYREHFRDIGIFENEVYEGIPTLLMNLKNDGCKIMLATSKPEEFAIKILNHFDLIDYFDFIGAATMDGSRNDKISVLRYVLSSNNINNLSETIMVGDRKFDILGAKEVGVDSIGVLFGYGSQDELENAGATYLAKNVMDIYDICQNK